MRNLLRSIANKMLFRKRASIETFNDELKSIAQYNTPGSTFLTTLLPIPYRLLQYTVSLKRAPPLMSILSMTGSLLFFDLYRNSRRYIKHIMGYAVYCCYWWISVFQTLLSGACLQTSERLTPSLCILSLICRIGKKFCSLVIAVKKILSDTIRELTFLFQLT